MKTIAVFGATGAQGGSVARALLSDGKYQVRAVTRNPASPAARKLRELGAAVVKADLDSPPSLNAALRGVDGVFGVTSFWEHYALEAKHGRHLIEAVAAAEVKHFVFSTLEPIADATGGKLRSPHFDIKAELEQITRERGIPASFIHVAFYDENFLAFFPPRPAGEGSYQFGFPQGDTPLAAVAVEDVGKIAVPLFDEVPMGRVVKVVGDEMPAARYAEILGAVTGAQIRYGHIPRETYAALGFPGAEDLADMFEYYRSHIPRREPEISLCRSIAPDMQTFAVWARRNKSRLRAAIIQAA